MNQTIDIVKKKSNELYEKLKTERDELELKTHLMKEELEDIWQASEKQWSRFRSKFSSINKGVGNAVSDLGTGFNDLGGEIKKAYKDIKIGIKSSELTK